jgi:hypothetical protein
VSSVVTPAALPQFPSPGDVSLLHVVWFDLLSLAGAGSWKEVSSTMTPHPLGLQGKMFSRCTLASLHNSRTKNQDSAVHAPSSLLTPSPGQPDCRRVPSSCQERQRGDGKKLCVFCRSCFSTCSPQINWRRETAARSRPNIIGRENEVLLRVKRRTMDSELTRTYIRGSRSGGKGVDIHEGNNSEYPRCE